MQRDETSLTQNLTSNTNPARCSIVISHSSWYRQTECSALKSEHFSKGLRICSQKNGRSPILQLGDFIHARMSIALVRATMQQRIQDPCEQYVEYLSLGQRCRTKTSCGIQFQYAVFVCVCVKKLCVYNFCNIFVISRFEEDFSSTFLHVESIHVFERIAEPT